MAAQLKRRLSDLWVVGREITLDDGAGEPVVVWLQKLTAIEGAESARFADAARARVLAVKNDPDSDEYRAIRAAALDYGDRDAIIGFLLAEDRVNFSTANEAQLAAEEEWSKDNYLQGLRDSWTDGLSDRWAKVENKGDDPEANHVFEELKRFTDEVADSVERDLEGPRERLTNTPSDELQTQMIDRLIELDAGQTWLDEFYRCQLYFGTRDPDNHRQRYFATREEVAEMSQVTYRLMRSHFENLEVDVMEGKGSQPPPTSSASPEPPSAVETVPSAGLAAAVP